MNKDTQIIIFKTSDDKVAVDVLFEKETALEVKFPLTVSIEIVKKLIKTEETKNNTPFGMYL